MAQGLSSTTFSEGPKKELIVVDAYGDASANAINSISQEIPETQLNTMKGLIPPVNTFGAAPEPTVPTAVEMSLESNTDFMKSLSPNVGSALSSLSPDLKSSILNVSGPSSLMATSGGVTSTITSVGMKSLTGMNQLMGAVSGKATGLSFTDTNSLAALGANIIKTATSIGIPNAYSIVTAGVTNQTALSAMTKQLLPTVIATSSVNLLSNIANGPVANQVTSMMPNFIPQFAQNYQAPRNMTGYTSQATANSVLSSFNRIDPQWNTAGTTYSSAPLSNSSPDMQQLLRTVASSGAPALLGGVNTNTSAINDGIKLAANLALGAFQSPTVRYGTPVDSTLTDGVRYNAAPTNSTFRLPTYTAAPTDTAACLASDFSTSYLT